MSKTKWKKFTPLREVMPITRAFLQSCGISDEGSDKMIEAIIEESQGGMIDVAIHTHPRLRELFEKLTKNQGLLGRSEASAPKLDPPSG